MAIIAPVQRQRRSCLIILLLILAGVILLGTIVGAILWFTTGGNLSIASKPIGIGIIVAPDGEHIGISDGTYAFDVAGRADASLKIQASADLKKGDITDAESLWQQALVKDTNDAETLIYQEDQRVLTSGSPYITLVVGTMLTGSNVNIGRDDLQGAYVAQEQYNAGYELNGGRQIRLLIANAGNNTAYTTTVAQQIVQAAKLDHTIVGVMGWPFSSYVPNEVSILAKAHIPMISPTASSDTLTGISPYFFRVAPPNKTQAIAGAKYAETTLHANQVALFVDPTNSYSESLANDFSQQFTADGNRIVVTEKYTVGKPQNLPTLLQNALSATPAPNLIYFAGYANDLGVLLTNLPASLPNLQVMGGDALYEVNGYPASARANFSRLHFTAFAYPDEWRFLEPGQEPAFFKSYSQDFDPRGQQKAGTYDYNRPDNDVILSYDAMLALLQGCNNILVEAKPALTPDTLQQGLARINGSHAISGISGQISFGSDGNPINKDIVVLYVDPNDHIKLQTVVSG